MFDTMLPSEDKTKSFGSLGNQEISVFKSPKASLSGRVDLSEIKYRTSTPDKLIPKAEVVQRFQAIQSWEGFVVDVNTRKGTFQARLVDLQKDGNPSEEMAELPLSDVDYDDVELVRPGAIFRWMIGYIKKTHEPKTHQSMIIFRRLPAWTKSDFDRANEFAEKLASVVPAK